MRACHEGTPCMEDMQYLFRTEGPARSASEVGQRAGLRGRGVTRSSLAVTRVHICQTEDCRLVLKPMGRDGAAGWTLRAENQPQQEACREGALGWGTCDLHPAGGSLFLSCTGGGTGRGPPVLALVGLSCTCSAPLSIPGLRAARVGGGQSRL